MRVCRATAMLLGLAAAALAVATAPVDFLPPVRVPAATTALATKVPSNALAQAGRRIVAAGQRGIIVYSDDGKNWRQAEVPVSSDLTALSFVNEKQGWAVGHEGVVLHTDDGGATWKLQLDGLKIAELLPDFVTQGIDKALFDVWFENEKSGYIVGAFGLILRTEDGGDTWQPWLDHVGDAGDMHLYAIRPAAGTMFIAGERGLVLKLDSQSRQFEKVTVPYDGTLFGVTGTAQTVLVFGLRGNVFRSTDGGTNWDKVETGEQAGISAGTLRSDGAIVLASQSGQVLLSTDEGVTFRKLQTGQAGPAFAVTEAADGNLAIAGFGGVRTEKVE
ncbi:MAG: YCF48-related protein [Pseudoxanthomonas sp.]